MIPELKQIKVQLTLFEQGVEEFMKKAEEAKNDNVKLNEENESLKRRISELEDKLREYDSNNNNKSED